MLAGGDVVAAGRVHHDDALLARRLGVDVFIAHAGPADDFQVFRRFDQFGGDLGAAANDPAVVIGADLLEILGLEPHADIDFKAAGILKYRQTFGSESVGNG